MNFKKLKYGASSYSLLIGFIVITILINMLAGLLVDKFNFKIDLTPNKIFNISKVTTDYLKTYNTPTKIYLLANEADQATSSQYKILKETLDKYPANNKNIKIEVIDLDKNPTFGGKYLANGVTLVSLSTVVDANDRFKVYNKSDLFELEYTQTGESQISGTQIEKKITPALQYVSSKENFNVAFVEGHGELVVEGAKTALTRESYEASTVNLLTSDIPSTIKLLVIVNPARDFSAPELAKLDTFFQNGGKGQIFIDPKIKGISNLYSFIKEWGIEVKDDIVVDQDNMVKGLPIVLTQLADSDITKSIASSKGAVAYFANDLTKSLSITDKANVTPLLTTSAAAYSKPIAATDIAKYNTGDPKGPFTISAISKKSSKTPDSKAMLMVSGSTMLLNYDPKVIEQQIGLDNFTFYVNSVKSLLGVSESTTIPAKQLAPAVLKINPSHIIFIIILLALMPIIALIMGILVWFRRRNA